MSYVNLMSLIEYEATQIPRFLRYHFGIYYNNAFGNGVLWALFIWSTFHLIYENLLEKVFKKLAIPCFLRLRLVNASWYLLFFSTNLSYCKYVFTTFSENTGQKYYLELADRNSNNFKDSSGKHGMTLDWDFIYISSFYLHTVVWEVLKGSSVPLNFLVLFVYLLFSYLLSVKDIAKTLLVVFSFVRGTIELSRLSLIFNDKHFSSSRRKRSTKKLIKVIFYTTIILSVVGYVVMIPFVIITSLMEKVKENHKFSSALLIISTLLIWLVTEIYNSPLKRLVYHWRHHRKEYSPIDCLGSLMECTMFEQRNDIVYTLKMLKIATKERQARMLAMRRPKKGTDMLFQTFKCMVALNRKIKLRAQKKGDSKIKIDEKEEEKIEKNCEQENEIDKNVKETSMENSQGDSLEVKMEKIK